MKANWEPGTGEAAEALGGFRGRRAPARAEAPRPSRFAARLFGVLAAVGSAVAVALAFPVQSLSSLAAPGGLFTAAGRMTGLLGTAFLLITVLLVGRIPALEGALGQDRLVRWHRRLGPWILILLSAHALFITVGYGLGARVGFAHELALLVTSFPGVLAATVSLGLLVLAGVTSYRLVRKHMRYETWWSVHLYTYLGAALSFSHQLTSGVVFIGHPLARAYWITLWLLTAGVVLVYRIGLPIVRSLTHRLKVVAVQHEAPDVVSIVVRGRRLDRLPVSGGQFLQWRFLTRGLWYQAHPYSLSALPNATETRITVKVAGDHSHALTKLQPGTRVAIEGPYGTFTKHARGADRVLLVGAGVGATPVRALLDDLPQHVDVVCILRASSRRELVLRDEIERLVGERGGRLHEAVGSRSQAPLDAAALQRLVPDVAARDLYVCGPNGFTRELIATARSLGVPNDRIHYEDFAF